MKKKIKKELDKLADKVKESTKYNIEWEYPLKYETEEQRIANKLSDVPCCPKCGSSDVWLFGHTEIASCRHCDYAARGVSVDVMSTTINISLEKDDIQGKSKGRKAKRKR